MRRGGYGRGIQFKPASGGGAAIPPPPSCLVNSRGGYTNMNAIHNAMRPFLPGQTGTGFGSSLSSSVTRRPQTEDEYFNDDPPEEPLAYIPAPGSPSYVPPPGSDDDDEDDPLDAFMAGIEKQVKKESDPKKISKTADIKGVRNDIEEEDDEETYYR